MNLSSTELILLKINSSMEPMIPQGATIHINTQSIPKIGDIVAAKDPQAEIHVGKLIVIDGKKHLTPLNKNYHSVSLSNCQVVGVAKQFAIDIGE
jgi:SOS-response transcriptional repressor LexA